jgi:hypothetical protein
MQCEDGTGKCLIHGVKKKKKKICYHKPGCESSPCPKEKRERTFINTSPVFGEIKRCLKSLYFNYTLTKFHCCILKKLFQWIWRNNGLYIFQD